MKWENGNIRGAVVFLGTRIGSRNAQLRQSGGIKYCPWGNFFLPPLRTSVSRLPPTGDHDQRAASMRVAR